MDIAENMYVRKVNSISPKVSIGLPVYNGEKHLRDALDSLLNQTFEDFELIVSDNASTDGTSKICQEYEKMDARIRYVRQEKNIGAERNFEFVLRDSTSEYFMWAADDDVWSKDFLENNLLFLEKNSNYVASISPVRFEDGDFNPVAMGDFELVGQEPERFEMFFNYWHANSRFYSLMRTSILKKCPYLSDGGSFFGSDWAIMLYVIKHGRTNRCSAGWVVRGNQGFSNSDDILKHYRRRVVHWFLPFYELNKATFDMVADFPLKHRALLCAYLIRINCKAVYASSVGGLSKLIHGLNWL